MGQKSSRKMQSRPKPTSLGRWLGIAVSVLTAVVLALGNGMEASEQQIVKSYAVEHAIYELCTRSDSLIAARNFAAARDLLVQAAASDPTSYSPYVHSQLSQCYAGLRNDQQALREAELAVRLNPANGNALYNLSVDYYNGKKYDLAISCLQKLIDTCTNVRYKADAQKRLKEVKAFKNLKEASECIESGREKQAKKLLESAAQYDPTTFSGPIHSALSVVYLRLADSDKALEEGKKSLAYDPNDKNTVYTIGVAYGDQARFAEGIQWINKYLSVETDPTRREDAQNTVKLFQEDLNQFNDPQNKLADYLEGSASENQRWSQERRPLKVYIAPANGVKGYRPGFTSYITRSLDTWCQASGNKLNYTLVKDADNCDVKVGFTAEPLNATPDHPNTRPAGLTHVQGVDEQIQSAVVSIRTVDPFQTKKVLQDGECASVCMHEIGHALGLKHSKFIKDIMYFRGANKQTGFPTVRDKATIAHLYSDYAAIAFTPKTTPTARASEPVQYGPPPSFMPPKAPDSRNLVPPMFLPPPLEKQKLLPPLFIPPPLSGGSAKAPAPTASPVDQGKKNVDPPFFMPPPVK